MVTLALAIEAKDPYMHGHSLQVKAWATAIGGELGLAGTRLQILSYAAELHDIGKLAVPDSILQANRRLTESEWVVIREHPRRGAELIKHLTFLKGAELAILYHHEKFDGTGYPQGLAGNQIPLEARILAVVDAYDAMTNVRAYRPAMSPEAAAVELHRCTGTQFAPEVVDAFLRIQNEQGVAAVITAAS
jgi:HD-GYP domain-containing protein (c-di-GMP phosphodiesterase class II)